MNKSYRPCDPDQQLLLPAALREWLPDDHLSYFISDVVDQLDLSEITARYERESRGGPPYHPRMMVKALLYGYCVGVASSRRIAQRLHEDIAFRVLAANNTPDFRAISDFRKDNLDALSGLFYQVLALCQQAGLVKLGHVALDGTKVRANASRHKAMSYGRMREKEAQLAAEVEESLRRAREVDDEEDRRYGQGRRGDELPEELSFREGRLEKIREAMAALEAEAEAAAEQAEVEDKDHTGLPDDKAQRNFTDAESRIMPAPGGRDFVQAYNCQAVVDSVHQVIVAARAANRTSDKRQAVEMVEEATDNVGAAPKEVSADAGYYSAQAVEGLYGLCVDPFVAPEQTRHGALTKKFANFAKWEASADRRTPDGGRDRLKILAGRPQQEGREQGQSPGRGKHAGVRHKEVRTHGRRLHVGVVVSENDPDTRRRLPGRNGGPDERSEGERHSRPSHPRRCLKTLSGDALTAPQRVQTSDWVSWVGTHSSGVERRLQVAEACLSGGKRRRVSGSI